MVAAGIAAALLSTFFDGVSATAGVTSAATGQGADVLQGATRRAEVERHEVLDQAAASLMRRERRASDSLEDASGDPGAGPKPPDWTSMSDFAGGYHSTPPEGFEQGAIPPGEPKPPAPVALRCWDGGQSGPSYLQTFDHCIQPLPPMSIVARVRTNVSREQAFMAWKPQTDDVEAQSEFSKAQSEFSEFLLTADGNLEFRLHDGYKHWNVTAHPAVNLSDGLWHTVAVVREGDNHTIGVATLYADAFQVGEGYFEGWAPHLQTTATSLAVHLDDGETQPKSFLGDIAAVRIFDEALSPSLVRSIGLEDCTVNVRLTGSGHDNSIVHSNLGGMGPNEGGEKALRFYRVATFRDLVLDLVVNNATEYLPGDPSRNGIVSGSVGRISLKAGSPTRLIFRFVKSGTNEDVNVDAFTMSFFHAEQDLVTGSKEVFTVEQGIDKYYVTNARSQISVSGSDLDASLTFTSRPRDPPTTQGGGGDQIGPAEGALADGPDVSQGGINVDEGIHPEELTEEQSEAAFGLRIVKSSALAMTIGFFSESEDEPRDILFGGISSIFTQGIATYPISL